MPTALPPRSITRRQGLLALAVGAPAVLLAACTSSSDEPAPEPTDAAPSPSTASVSAADEAALIAQYDAALASLDTTDEPTRALLTMVRDQHAAHLEALGGAPAASAGPAPTGTRNRVLRQLVKAERAAADDRILACVDATDTELARLLCLIAASEAAHVPALRDLLDGGAA